LTTLKKDLIALIWERHCRTIGPFY